jgi:flagellar protein FliO/FliZ
MDYALYLRAVMSLVFVLGLLLALSWAVRRFNLAGALSGSLGAMPRGMGGRQRRLGVAESLALDARRRLVLVRRDGTEHLLLLGLAGETVIETGIAARPALTEIAMGETP